VCFRSGFIIYDFTDFGKPPPVFVPVRVGVPEDVYAPSWRPAFYPGVIGEYAKGLAIGLAVAVIAVVGAVLIVKFLPIVLIGGAIAGIGLLLFQGGSAMASGGSIQPNPGGNQIGIPGVGAAGPGVRPGGFDSGDTLKIIQDLQRKLRRETPWRS
jgi:hypothetical protein